MEQNRIGSFIQMRRKNFNMTQKELAEKIGVSDKTISKWENGVSMPDIDLIHKICLVLQINVNELICGELIPPESYSTKAEENIMQLLKENEGSKGKKYILQIVIGCVLAVIGILLLMINVYGISFFQSLSAYLDISMFFILMILVTALSFMVKYKGIRGLLKNGKQLILPIGGIVSVFQLINALFNNDVLSIAACVGIAILPMLYSLIIYVVFYIVSTNLEERNKHI